MTSYSQNDFSLDSSHHDSFEANILQMEHTNKLLSNLEDKISTLFSNNPASVTNNVASRRSPTNAHKSETTYSTKFPTDQKDYNRKNRAPLTSIENNMNQNQPYLSSSIEKEYLKSSHQHYSSPEQPIAPMPSVSRTSPTRHEPLKERNTLKVISEESPTNESTSRLRGQTQAYEQYQRDLNRSAERSVNYRGSANERYSSRPENSFLDKMGNIERFYKEKIEILEERILGYEEETLENARINEGLVSEVNELRMALDRARQVEQSYGNWRQERKAFEQEMEELRKINVEIRSEKEELERRYEGMLKVHREMIQLDMERNEKNLRSSQSERNLERKEEKTTRESEKVKAVLELVEQYKGELETLRGNNSEIRKQFMYEISQLKEELEAQKRENRRLIEREDEGDGMNRLERSGDQRREMVRKKDEDLKRMSGRELANYVKEWRDYYLEDENKLSRSSGHENYNIFNTTGNKEKAKRVEESFGKPHGESVNESIL